MPETHTDASHLGIDCDVSDKAAMDAEAHDITDALALIEEAARTPGAHVDHDLRLVGRALGVFTTNAAHLRVELDRDRDIESMLRIASEDQAALERRLDEIDRLLHNFLAAAFTISQHTMRVRKRYASDEFLAEYAAKSPFDEPELRLVSLIRNDTQHAHLPVVLRETKFTMDPPSFDVRYVIARNYLASLDLNATMLAFVDSLDDDPVLADLVDHYTLRVEEFTRWFVTAVVLLRAEDLVETHALRKKALELARQLPQVLER